jgi:hypothetical protein
LQDGSYNGHFVCSKWSQLNVEITVVSLVLFLQAGLPSAVPSPYKKDELLKLLSSYHVLMFIVWL